MAIIQDTSVIFSEDMLETLSEMQEDNNSEIEMMGEYCDDVSRLLREERDLMTIDDTKTLKYLDKIDFIRRRIMKMKAVKE